MADETVTSSATETAQPVLAPADVTTKIDGPADTVETAAETTPAPELEPETDEGEQETKKRPSGSERYKRKLAQIETEFETLARENEELRRRTADGGQSREGKPGVDRPPTEQDFPNDYLAFERAANAWNVKVAIREEIGVERAKSRDSQLREIRQERIESYQESANQARERIPDFDKVLAGAQSVQISPALGEEIMSSDKAALLQYHLAQKPELVRELNGMSGRELAREIGRLEARVHLPTAKKATEASPPPSQVRGAAAPPVDAQSGPDDMNAYVAWRRKQAKA
jgi:hypothetical protein